LTSIIAFSGAGISAESNIPTFQDIPGIREKLTRDYATTYPKEYAKVIAELKSVIDKAEPNAAHISLAEYDILVITMNIDDLHQKAGSKNVIAVHGSIDNIVLYGDMAPMYSVALDRVLKMNKDDIFLVIGASLSTMFSYQIKEAAKYAGAQVVEIQEKAAEKVPEFLKNYFRNCED